MTNYFKYKKTIVKENGLKTFLYEMKDSYYKVEIDEILVNSKIEYVIANCSITYWANMINSRAKTRKTLLNRLDTLFMD